MAKASARIARVHQSSQASKVESAARIPRTEFYPDDQTAADMVNVHPDGIDGSWRAAVIGRDHIAYTISDRGPGFQRDHRLAHSGLQIKDFSTGKCEVVFVDRGPDSVVLVKLIREPELPL